MKPGKLIRDRIPKIIKAKGQIAVTHVAGDQEYWDKLKAKLREEAGEFSVEEKDEELADILEVIHAIADFKKIDWPELERIRLKKRQERGGFESKIILDNTPPN